MTTAKQKKLETLTTLEALIYLAKVCAKPISGDYFTPNWTWKWNFHIFQVIGCCLLTAICYCWTGYENRHELTEFVFSACLIMVDILAMQRLIKFAKDQPKIYEKIEYLLVYTKRWETVEEAFPVLLWYFRLLRRVILGISVILVILGTLIISFPILYFLIFDEMVLTIQCFIPYINYTKHPGFEIHLVFHTWCSFCCLIGINATTMIVLLLLVQNCIEIDVLKARLKVLTGIIHNIVTQEEDVSNLVKDIFEEHQALNGFIDACEDLFSIQYLSDHFVFGIQTCLALFICLRQFWLPGYLLTILGLVIIFTLHLLGTIIEVKLEKLTFDVYDVPWYLMSVKNQKMYWYFLGNTQNTTRFTVGGRVSLNLDTFVRFYKRIYSYLMVLQGLQV